MKAVALWALVVVNVALAVALTLQMTGSQPAWAQGRPRGDYTMIPSQLTGITSGVVLIVDQTTDRLTGITFDENRRRIESLPAVDLTRVLQSAPGGAPPP